MTVNELQNILKSLQDKGYGNIKIGIPVDQYNMWVYDIDKIKYRPIVNCFAICTSDIEHKGIDINKLRNMEDMHELR